jgi:mannose-1-phosphate guanylyltransferase
MEALILSAGEGTRLRPLTRLRPKPLFPILNQPLLQITLNYLKRFSLDRVILNTHHLADQIEEFVQAQKKRLPLEIETRFEPILLNTGGGIGNTRDFWRSDPFLVINGDILTDIDLHKAIEFHQTHNGPVTLVLHDYPEFNQIKVDKQGRIKAFRNTEGQGLAFTGIHLLSREIFQHLPSSGAYDIIPIYQRMIKQGLPIWGYISQDHYWRDIGTPQSYLKVHEELLSRNPPSLPLKKGGTGRILIHPETVIEKGVDFSGWVCIGKGCQLKTGSRIRNSVLWENVVMESGSSVADSILGRGVHLRKNIRGEVLI